MLSLKSFVTASAALTLVSGVSANVVKRNGEPAQPSCTDFTPFEYAGCFQDPSSPRALLYDSGLNSQNMTVEICVAFCKGNDYKYAGLEYYGECFCGASVNGPAVDESKCNFPCTGDSSEACGGFDIISIYQDTTFPTVDDATIADYKPMGCYSEGTPGRSLAWRQDQVSATDLTVESCLFACKDGGYDFAGVEYGQECYCGVVLGNGTLPVDDSKCNMPCTGDATETCGGSGTLNLYVATDLESTEPCNASPPSSSSTTSQSSTSSSTLPPSSTTIITTSSSSKPSTTPTTSSISSSTSSSLSTTSSTTSSSSKPSTTPSSSAPSTTPTTSSTSCTETTSSSSKPSTTPSTSSTSSNPTTASTLSTSSSKPTTTPPPTTSSTKTTASLCTSTVTVSPAPTCEYKCGRWCSSPLPPFNDGNSCFKAVASCTVQLASCFATAGFPDSLNCFQFASWCSKVEQYCSGFCPGNSCSLGGCKNKYPPTGPSAPAPVLSTSVYTCPAASSTAPSKPTTTPPTAPSSTSCVPIPTNSNICTQPSNPRNGYSSGSPVGGIPLPCLTCNNKPDEYRSGNCFKLYTDSDSNKCPSYPRSGRNGPGKGCKDACDAQYKSCIGTYAEGCKGNSRGDSYGSASQKCKNQWSDCYDANSGVSVSGSRCGSFNTGWW